MLVKSAHRNVFQKRPLYSMSVGVHKCNPRLVKQGCRLLLLWADRTAYIRKPASEFGSRKESDFPA